MLIAWSAIFPGVMVRADAGIEARIFIFCGALLLDAIFTIEMYKDFTEFRRLKRKIKHHEDKRIEAL